MDHVRQTPYWAVAGGAKRHSRALATGHLAGDARSRFHIERYPASPCRWLRRGLRLGFVEPHLRRYGGVRRMVEFANRLAERGHEVAFYLPDHQDLRCSWMRCDAVVKPLSSGVDDEIDIVLFNDERQWYLLRFVPASTSKGVLHAALHRVSTGKRGVGRASVPRSTFSWRTATGLQIRSAPRPGIGRRFSSAGSTVTSSVRSVAPSAIPCSARAVRAGLGRGRARSSRRAGS